MDTRGIFFGHRWNLGADGQPLDAEARERILNQIAQGREKQVLVTEQLTSLPSWAQAPFQEEQKAFNDALKAFQDADPTVSALEKRLSTEPGPIWRNLSSQEEEALADWTKAADTMGGLVEKYFPSESLKDIRKIALLLLGVGAIFGPLLWTEDEGEARAKGWLRPLIPPTGPRPQAMPAGPLPLPPGVLPFRPAGAPPAPGVLRPAVTSFAPGVALPPPGAVPGAVPPPTPTPRFARPLTPSAGTFIYPRYGA